MDWRKNEGYIITNSIAIGNVEIVLGVHEKRPNMFATWECLNKTEFTWPHYSTNLLDAQKDFCERGAEKARFYEHLQRKPKEKELER